MKYDQIIHNIDTCHNTKEIPNEKVHIIINADALPTGELNVGYYESGKWFKVGGSEIQESNIICWHELNTEE